MTEPQAVEVPIAIVIAERDDGAARQREMAEHVRDTGMAWLELAESLDRFADYLDSLPRASSDLPEETP